MLRHERDEGATVDPWIEIQPDSRRHTGGDWYQLLLSATLGFKAVHGANTSPTCEVLCKADKKQHDLDNYGVISWDDTLQKPTSLGCDLSDHFYTHHPYRGTITASGCILAYESGLWEPSVRRRARSSALLAAGLAVHGCSKAEAIHTVSKISGEELDIEAVDSAILPASHLKREMVLVSKASHRIFSRGTLQSGIQWYDSKLTGDAVYRNVAFDWGRVTALARYIAEANVQNCQFFRYFAKTEGIPYSIVRNAWAYVSDNDYRLPLSMFDEVPSVDVRALGIPSLRGSFVGHEQDIMIALNRGKAKGVMVPENDAFRSYADLLMNARARRGKRKRSSVATPAEARPVILNEHSINAENVVDLLEGSKVVRNAYLMAIASRRRCDPELDQLLDKVAKADLANEADCKKVDDASTVIYDSSFWLIARAIAESSLKKDPKESMAKHNMALTQITLGLTRMRQHIVGFPTHIENAITLSVSQLVSVRVSTVSYARESAQGIANVTYTQRSLVSRQIQDTSRAMSSITHAGSKILAKIRSELADKFDEWYLDSIRSPHEAVRTATAHYALLVSLFRNINEALCFNKVSGYIEGTLPRRSYVYQGVIRTCSDLGYDIPKLQRLSYTDAFQLARELDLSQKIGYSVQDAVTEVIRITDLVIGDLLLGRLWRPDPDMYQDLYMMHAPPMSPQYDDSMLTEAEMISRIEAMMAVQNAERKSVFATGYAACLNTYPSEALGNKYARVMGFPDLKGAFDMLGNDVYYSDENQFIQDARAKLALTSTQSDSSSSEGNKDYSQLI